MPNENWLERLCAESTEFARLHQELQETRSAHSCSTIAVCGLMNAGKSSLLNAMTGHMKEEFFATKSTRSTIEVKELTLNGITYVDTPGIDACDTDDAQAWRGVANADWIVFAHNLRTGTLETCEVDFLKELQRRRPDIEQHLVVALTNAESAEDQKEDRVTAIRDILNTVFVQPPALVATSYTRHRKGTLENKPGLIERSGIAQLHQQLKQLIESCEGGWQAVRAAREEARYAQFEALVDQAIRTREDQLKEITRQQRRTFTHWYTDLNDLSANLRDRLTHYQSL